MKLVCAFLVVFSSAFAQAPGYLSEEFSFHQQGKDFLNRTFLSPSRNISLGVSAFIDVVSDHPREFDRSPSGFGCYAGSRFGNRLVKNAARLGFEQLFGQISTYHPTDGRKSIPIRLKYTTLTSFLSHRADGSREIPYARLAADAVAVAVSSTWRNRPLTGAIIGRTVMWDMINRFEDNLFAEFVQPKLEQIGKRVVRKFKRK